MPKTDGGIAAETRPWGQLTVGRAALPRSPAAAWPPRRHANDPSKKCLPVRTASGRCRNRSVFAWRGAAGGAPNFERHRSARVALIAGLTRHPCVEVLTAPATIQVINSSIVRTLSKA